MTSHGDHHETSPSLGSAICETVATFVGSWRSSGGVSYGDHHETSESRGGCDLRNCGHFRGLLGGPARWCLTHIRMKPRRPLGVAIRETVATFVGSWEVQRGGV